MPALRGISNEPNPSPMENSNIMATEHLKALRSDFAGMRTEMQTVKFAEAVFVLHCFQKKSKRGIATPKQDMDIIHARLKIAETYVKELRK